MNNRQLVWFAIVKRAQWRAHLEYLHAGWGKYLWFWEMAKPLLPEGVMLRADTSDYGNTLWCVAEREGRPIAARALVGVCGAGNTLATGEQRWESCDLNGEEQWTSDDDKAAFRRRVVDEFVAALGLSE